MSKFSFVLVSVLALAGLSFTSAQAQDLDSAGLRASTLGYGAELGFKIIPTLSVRGIVNAGRFSGSYNSDSIHYAGKLNLASQGLVLDFKPLPILPFYLSAGLYNNDNKANITGNINGPTTIGNNSYTAAQIGTLGAKVTFNKLAQYYGVGARMNILAAELNLEAGAFVQQDPKLVLTANGTLTGTAAFSTDLATEQSKTQSNLSDKLRVYPALTAALRVKF